MFEKLPDLHNVAVNGGNVFNLELTRPAEEVPRRDMHGYCDVVQMSLFVGGCIYTRARGCVVVGTDDTGASHGTSTQYKMQHLYFSNMTDSIALLEEKIASNENMRLMTSSDGGVLFGVPCTYVRRAMGTPVWCDTDGASAAVRSVLMQIPQGAICDVVLRLGGVSKEEYDVAFRLLIYADGVCFRMWRRIGEVSNTTDRQTSRLHATALLALLPTEIAAAAAARLIYKYTPSAVH